LNTKFPSEDSARVKQSIKGLDFDCNKEKYLTLNILKGKNEAIKLFVSNGKLMIENLLIILHINQQRGNGNLNK